MMRTVSTALAALWLALAITCASAGAASPSADDSRLLPGGSAAHLWLLPKVGNPATSKVLPGLRDSASVTRTLASSRNVTDRSSLLRQPREPFSVKQLAPQRRLPPRRASGDPPLAS